MCIIVFAHSAVNLESSHVLKYGNLCSNCTGSFFFLAKMLIRLKKRNCGLVVIGVREAAGCSFVSSALRVWSQRLISVCIHQRPHGGVALSPAEIRFFSLPRRMLITTLWQHFRSWWHKQPVNILWEAIWGTRAFSTLWSRVTHYV